MNIRIGKVSKWLTPDLSQCERCQTTWAFVKERVVDYDEHNGCFALCEKCWRETSTHQRIEFFYTAWQQHWYKQRAWSVVRDAVLRQS